ncbi:hypothetical protein [Mangrovivirga cuniculi]|uniref:Lipoprotein n=1 Tax=Mangrovivirga cuniculi TaxID=2715131 RepID=A0A4D7JSI1_9BACT|nr:hypothetical protein [Mangrovivirga cuniculi]QCK15036.1 hypothetical protein DCC35_09900 [Mangrovivirga cuniculi]
MKLAFRFKEGFNFLSIIGLSLVLFTACMNNGPVKLPLEQIDESTRSYGSHIVQDILKSIRSDEGAHYLIEKEYITPKIYQGIRNSGSAFGESYFLINMMLGNVKSYKLFGGEQTQIIKSLRYKLKVENQDLKFVELKIDLNAEDDLAGYYLYVTSKDGKLKHENLLPKIVLR